MSELQYHDRAKLLSVQALRGIAALLVVIFHIDAMFREGAPRSRDFGDFWARGFAGVDLFFVISGFIMVWVTAEILPSIRSAGKFLYNRIVRIYPLWWIFAGLMILYFYVSNGALAAPDKASGDAIGPYILKSLLLIPQTHEPVLGVGWTLIHEMLFYILFALGLLLPRKFLPIWLATWTLAIIAFGLLGPALPIHAKNFGQLFVSPLNLEFVLGACVAIYLLRENSRSSPLWLFAGIALFTLGLLFHLPGKYGSFNWIRALAYGVPCAMIILGAVWMERQGKLNVPSPLQLLGDWSYSLYLSHFLVIRSLKRLWLMADPHLPAPIKWGAEGWLDNVVYIILALIASITFAAISYHLIERTSLKLLKGKPEA